MSFGCLPSTKLHLIEEDTTEISSPIIANNQNNQIEIIVSKETSVTEMNNSKMSVKDVRKKMADIIFKNVKSILEDPQNSNDKNMKIKLDFLNRVRQYGKEKQLDKANLNSKRLLHNHFADIIDLTNSSDSI